MGIYPCRMPTNSLYIAAQYHFPPSSLYTPSAIRAARHPQIIFNVSATTAYSTDKRTRPTSPWNRPLRPGDSASKAAYTFTQSTMDFAPYQSSPPEHSRPFSPAQSPSPRVSNDRKRSGIASPPPLQHPQPKRQWAPTLPGGYSQVGGGTGGSGGFGNEAGYGVDAFDTSLGLRLDYEAAACYLALPPLGAIILLILERKSDYVR